MCRNCVVLVAPHAGRGHYPHEVTADSSMEAAALALNQHFTSVPNDALLTVIVDGRIPMLAGGPEHNTRQTKYRHTAGAVRLWAKRREWEAIIGVNQDPARRRIL